MSELVLSGSLPSRKTIIQVFLVALQRVSYVCLFKTAISAWVAFSDNLALTHSKIENFLLIPSYCE